MDLSKWIHSKRIELVNLKPDSQIDIVLRHLNIAESHFERGLVDSDHYFTDVIYRTNQVFEGILKEIYEVTSKKSAGKKTPAKIEEYLESEKSFNARLLKYFSIYRQDWRNPSTHDHRLDFNEQEAFAALSSVSTFCYVSIDQMIYTLAESSVALKSKRASLDLYAHELLGKQLVKGIQDAIGAAFKNLEENGGVYSEAAFVGLVAGVFRSLYDDTQVVVDGTLSANGRVYRPDLIIKAKTKDVIVEVKTLSNHNIGDGVRNATFQLEDYMEYAKTDFGVIVAIPRDANFLQPVEFKSYVIERKNNIVLAIVPKPV